MALWSKSSPASSCLSRNAPPIRCPGTGGNGAETLHLSQFILPVTSELRRLLSCASKCATKWMAPTHASYITLLLTTG
ncbi:hypothetical protein ILYODFUR_038695 [Ilyodon furcidens]|uniref:Uncharacterized protein n=1 Tax=Ilyodon furcidens TaxID=33524 RepID=A0ABV0VL43_9TELE